METNNLELIETTPTGYGVFRITKRDWKSLTDRRKLLNRIKMLDYLNGLPLRPPYRICVDHTDGDEYLISFQAKDVKKLKEFWSGPTDLLGLDLNEEVPVILEVDRELEKLF